MTVKVILKDGASNPMTVLMKADRVALEDVAGTVVLILYAEGTKGKVRSIFPLLNVAMYEIDESGYPETA